jgi:hypothetical protein
MCKKEPAGEFDRDCERLFTLILFVKSAACFSSNEGLKMQSCGGKQNTLNTKAESRKRRAYIGHNIHGKHPIQSIQVQHAIFVQTTGRA